MAFPGAGIAKGMSVSPQMPPRETFLRCMMPSVRYWRTMTLRPRKSRRPSFRRSTGGASLSPSVKTARMLLASPLSFNKAHSVPGHPTQACRMVLNCP